MRFIWPRIHSLWWNLHHLLIQKCESFCIEPLPSRKCILHNSWYLMIISKTINKCTWNRVLLHVKKEFTMTSASLFIRTELAIMASVQDCFHLNHLCLPVNWLFLYWYFQKLVSSDCATHSFVRPHCKPAEVHQLLWYQEVIVAQLYWQPLDLAHSLCSMSFDKKSDVCFKL